MASVRHLFKKPWIVASGVLAAILLVGATVTGAIHLTRAQKEALLAEKQTEADQLKAEYLKLAKEGDERADIVGNQAKDLAVVTGQLQAEVGSITDERLEMRFRTHKAALSDGLSSAEGGGFSDLYVDTIEQYLQEVEALEHEFVQHTRTNEEINAALDELSDQWNPIIDEIYRQENNRISLGVSESGKEPNAGSPREDLLGPGISQSNIS